MDWIRQLKTPLLALAPMAGYTHAPFRLLCREQGCGLTFTEVVAAEGIVRRVPKTLHYLETLPGEGPTAAHIYGAAPDLLAQATAIVASLGRFCSVDINCGCPVPKIKGKGAGVALMRDPDRLRSLVAAVAAASPLPVTIKTRLGLNPAEANLSEVAQAAEEGGAAALFVHARFASQRHAGPADWDSLARIKRERSIPLIGNGGVDRAADAPALLSATGVDGVMIGRAAVGAPWIFAEVRCLLEGAAFEPLNDDALLSLIERHLVLLCEHFEAERRLLKHPRYTGEQAACRKFRCHLIQYLRGRRGIRALLAGLEKKETVQGIIAETAAVLRDTAPQECRTGTGSSSSSSTSSATPCRASKGVRKA